MRALRVYARHCRAAGYCLTPGIRSFCETNNFDFRDFIANGIAADLLLATGDAMANVVVEIAKKEQEAQHGQ